MRSEARTSDSDVSRCNAVARPGEIPVQNTPGDADIGFEATRSAEEGPRRIVDLAPAPVPLRAKVLGMDIATLIGLIGSFAIIISAMVMGGSADAFINAPSLLIVVGGTLAVTLVHQKLGPVFGAFKSVANAFFDKSQSTDELIPAIVNLAQKARKEGLVSLEGEEIADEFMSRGIRLGVDGLSPELVTATLRNELSSLKKRHEVGQKVFRFMAGTAPSMGMIGTLVGLVQMLRTLDDPSAIGPSMAVALLTTLYGAILAFVVFNPLAEKLENRTLEEVTSKTLTIAGVASILQGDNSMAIQSKLEAYLAPGARAGAEQDKD